MSSSSPASPSAAFGPDSRARRWVVRGCRAHRRHSGALRRSGSRAPDPRCARRATASRAVKPRRDGSKKSRQLFASKALIVDDCRYAVRADGRVIPLAGRPVLFTLARALAEAWPKDVSRDELCAAPSECSSPMNRLRARLRVEMGRLRKALKGRWPKSGHEARLRAETERARKVVVLARPMEEEHAAVLAFLADGESWATRRWRWRWAPVNAACSARWTISRPRARCRPMARAVRAAG